MTGAILLYCGGHRTLARPVGLGFYKCARCGVYIRGIRGRMSAELEERPWSVIVLDSRKGTETVTIECTSFGADAWYGIPLNRLDNRTTFPKDEWERVQ